MQKYKTTYLITLFLFFLFSVPDNIYGAEQDNTARMAFQLFDSGDYQGAQPYFEILVRNNPDVSMLNYYYGACLTENGVFSEKVLNILLLARQEEIPARLDYYLGLQYHAREEWDQALRHYNRFKLNGPQKEQQKYLLPEKIQQCYDRVNPYTLSEESVKAETAAPVVPDVPEQPDTAEVITGPSVTETVLADTLASSLAKTTGSSPENENSVQKIGQKNVPETEQELTFRINHQFTYYNALHFRTNEGKTAFLEGEKKRDELENTLQQIDRLRKVYAVAETAEKKTSTGNSIVELENSSYTLQDEINKLFSLARSSEEKYWQNATEDEKNAFISETRDYLRKEKSLTPENIQTDTLLTSVIIPGTNALLSEPVSGSVVAEPEKDNEPVYKIQIGAYKNSPPSYMKKLFQKLSLIRKIDKHTDENGVIVYTTGSLSTFDDAVILQKQVRQEGVKDAFVVSYFNGKRITLEEAKTLEQGK